MHGQTIQLPAWIPWAALLLIGGPALIRGGWLERTVATVIILACLAARAVDLHGWLQLEWGVFIVDVVTWGALLAVALRSDRYWPLCVAAFQMLNVMTHVARIADPQFTPWAYATAQVIWTYLMILTLGYAAWRRILLQQRARRADQASP